MSTIPTSFHIRQAVMDDAAALATLHVAAWQWAFRGQLPDAFLDGLTSTIDRRLARRRARLGRALGEHRTWVVDVAGRIVGFADTDTTKDPEASSQTAELQRIFLDHDTVGKGVGRSLLAHVVDDLQRRQFLAATLWVLASNARARRFYEAAGWCLDGATKTVMLDDAEWTELRYRIDL